MNIRTFLKVGKAKHIGHKPFLLAVSAGHSQYVLSPVISAQQKMAEILIYMTKRLLHKQPFCLHKALQSDGMIFRQSVK